MSNHSFDFTTVINRVDHDALAVDAPYQSIGMFEGVKRKEGFDVIPMWVADMNFPAPSCIADAIKERAAHPLFGYFMPSKEYYDAIAFWQGTRNGVDPLSAHEIGYENGVLGGVVSAVNILASRGDSILLHSPTYVGFTGALENAGYHLVLSPLVRDQEGIFRMDYSDMERKIVKHNIHVLVLSSPHNPTGRVWEREELQELLRMCEKHGVYVISDEIWSDLILGEKKHIPTQSVNEYGRSHTIAFYAPSKTFNLAGLVGSYHIVYDRYLQDRLKKEGSLSHYNNMNVLSMHALIGAYSKEGAAWVDELNKILFENTRNIAAFLRSIGGIKVADPEGTYMLFPDFAEYLVEHKMTMDELLHRGWEYGVCWMDGRPFHGETALRINAALPESRIAEAIRRMEQFMMP